MYNSNKKYEINKNKIKKYILNTYKTKKNDIYNILVKIFGEKETNYLISSNYFNNYDNNIFNKWYNNNIKFKNINNILNNIKLNNIKEKKEKKKLEYKQIKDDKNIQDKIYDDIIINNINKILKNNTIINDKNEIIKYDNILLLDLNKLLEIKDENNLFIEINKLKEKLIQKIKDNLKKIKIPNNQKEIERIIKILNRNSGNYFIFKDYFKFQNYENILLFNLDNILTNITKDRIIKNYYL